MDILAFYLGILFTYTQSLYVPFIVVIGLFIRRGRLWLAYLILGVGWALFHNYHVIDEGMPTQPLISNVLIKGVIQSLPVQTEAKTSFDFLITAVNGKPAKAILRLSCYRDCEKYKQAQIWKLRIKLKRPRNFGNPGSFDYVQSLRLQHIYWIGYIKSSVALISQKSVQPLLDLRLAIAQKLKSCINDETTLGIVEALTLGLTHHLNQAQWQLFRETGTTHLIVISGSHIVLIAGFFYGLMWWLWSRSYRLCLYKPAPQVASFVSILVALIYAFLAGFSVPVQRAVLAYVLYHSRHFFAFPMTSWQSWRYGILLVVAIEPHSVLLPGSRFIALC